MSIHVFYGCMMASKTKSLIAAIREQPDPARILVIKYVHDTRYSNGDEIKITSHDGDTYPATAYADLWEIPEEKLKEIDAIFIDEGQFFSGLLQFSKQMKGRGKHIYVAGLDLDYRRKAFGDILSLLEITPRDHRHHLKANCEFCHTPNSALYSHRFNERLPVDQLNQRVVFAGKELYAPVCAICWDFD